MLNKKNGTQFLLNNAVILLMLCAALAVGIMRPAFFSLNNMRNLISNTAARFIIALGVSGCLITKGTDLSAGRSVGLAACLAATFLQRIDYTAKIYPNLPNLNIVLVFLAIIAITMLIGAVNGMVVSYLKVPPFIATLGMQTIIYGACLVFTGAQPIGGLRNDYTVVANGSLANIFWPPKDINISTLPGVPDPPTFLSTLAGSLPYLGFYAVLCGIVVWIVYNKTSHGKYMYAIGGNENAAEVSGINSSRTKIIIYATAGLLYGIAGFLMGAKAGGASVNLGQGYELEAIAGCTIGGVSTSGGVGRVPGILLGVLVFELLKIAMQFMGIEPSYTYIVQGVVIVFAVALDIRKYVAKK